MSRMAAGEKSAFSDCIANFGDLVWSLARRMTRTTADAEDAVQDIFLKVWQNAARFDPGRGTAVVFIDAIARRTLIERLRQRSRRIVKVHMETKDSPA